MELKIDLAYEQLFMLVKQLPNKQKVKLYKDLSPEINIIYFEQEGKKKKETTDFQNLLLNGQVMSDEQFNEYKNLRNSFNS